MGKTFDCEVNPTHDVIFNLFYHTEVRNHNLSPPEFKQKKLCFRDTIFNPTIIQCTGKCPHQPFPRMGDDVWTTPTFFDTIPHNTPADCTSVRPSINPTIQLFIQIFVHPSIKTVGREKCEYVEYLSICRCRRNIAIRSEAKQCYILINN